MKYLKFFLNKMKKVIQSIVIILFPSVAFLLFIFFAFALEGYSLEEIGLDFISLNPNDYCNITDVDYTAVLHDDINGKANVEITEYITFDVHASSTNNTYKELWRELPEDTVDGLNVTYDVESVTQILDNGEEVPYIKTSKMYWEDEDYTQNSTMRWHHSKGTGRYPDNDESLLIYIPWTYREKMTFKIVYSMNNAALKYNDCSELYLSMYSGNTITKLNSYKAQILIPDDLMPSTYNAYTFGTANSRIPFTESNTINPGYHTFSLNLDKNDLKFNYHNRYLEFCLLSYGKDKHIFTKYAPNNDYSFENVFDECIAENEYYKNQNEIIKICKITFLILSLISSIIIIYRAKQKYRKIKEKYVFYEPEIDYEYFRDIPSDLDPIFASELVFMKDPFNENKEKKEEYAAILLSLVRKQYVKISKSSELLDNDSIEWDSNNILISLEPIKIKYSAPEFADSPDYSPEPTYTVINKKTGAILEPLTTSERLYYELLERHSRNNNSITLKQLQNSIDLDYEHTNAFVNDIEKKPILENGVMQGYFQEKDYDLPKKELLGNANASLIIGLFFLLLVNGISYFTPLALSFGAYSIIGIICLWKYFYLSAKASNSVLFTQYGINEQAKWYGLYNFLNSDTLLKEKEVYDLPLWEKYLIYATAFGISEKVIKAIKIHAEELNINNSLILNQNSYIHHHYSHRISRSFGHSIHTTSRGGGFSGHGYGGGGRGGGGGGGGH